MEENNADKITPQDTKNLRVDLSHYFSDLVKNILDLDKGVDKWGTIREIKSKQSMSGANAWMLICSIMIASIGLNLDSEAVIIGAMLISPLMSPILGIGMAVGVNDKDALYHALLHFGAAIIIALFCSTFYFWLSPMDKVTPQIEARTHPTFLDILIAIFGGIAGIVSIARKDISTTLPGVAIATALMPPICVAGYGLANGSVPIASKAFYLFFLNSFFVAFATYFIVRRMHFPFKEYANPIDKRKNITIVSIFSILMIVPSLLIFRAVYQEYLEDQKLEAFIAEEFQGDIRNYLDDYMLLPENEPTKLLLKVYGNEINQTNLKQYYEGLSEVGLDYISSIEIISTNEIDLDNIDQMQAQLIGLDDKLNTQIKQLVQETEARKNILEEISKRNSFFSQDSTKFDVFCNQLKIFFPDVIEVGMAVTQYTDFNDLNVDLPTILVKAKKPKNLDKIKIAAFIKSEYQLDTVKVISYQ